MLGLELFLMVFLIAVLYGSVGHGGASAYLAVLSLMMVNHQVASTTALTLNLFVAGIALISYCRAGHFSFRLTMPFLLASVPLAFLGGYLKVSTPVYNILLALALLASALRMVAPRIQKITEQDLCPPNASMALLTGSGLGFLSGVVGVGGGIFLSPLMIMLRWANPKTTSATAAAFILANSIAGLCGRLSHGGLVIEGFLPLVFAGVFGGWLGSYYGARLAPNPILCRLLALVMMLAAGKMLLQGA